MNSRPAGLRAALFDRETLGYRIRDAELQKVPYMGVVGEREAEAGTVAVRKQGAGKKQEIMARDVFAQALKEEVRKREVGQGREGGKEGSRG